MHLEPHSGPVGEDASRSVPIPANALVLLPHLHDDDVNTCLDLLTVAPPSDENVLLVSFEETAADKSRRWTDGIGTRPSEFAVIDVGHGSSGEHRPGPAPGGAAAATPADVRESDVSPTTYRISDPRDLTSLAAAISRQLSRWADSAPRTVVCIQSLTALSEHVGLRRLFRFVHVLGRRLTAADAVSHFHLDPRAVEERTLYTLLPLFDTVVERDDGGTVRSCYAGTSV
jgi:hypothetical protein